MRRGRGRNPVGVEAEGGAGSQGSAGAAQPWAGGRNAVGVEIPHPKLLPVLHPRTTFFAKSGNGIHGAAGCGRCFQSTERNLWAELIHLPRDSLTLNMAAPARHSARFRLWRSKSMAYLRVNGLELFGQRAFPAESGSARGRRWAVVDGGGCLYSSVRGHFPIGNAAFPSGSRHLPRGSGHLPTGKCPFTDG